jgi:hypothetical protein
MLTEAQSELDPTKPDTDMKNPLDFATIAYHLGKAIKIKALPLTLTLTLTLTLALTLALVLAPDPDPDPGP